MVFMTNPIEEMRQRVAARVSAEKARQAAIDAQKEEVRRKLALTVAKAEEIDLLAMLERAVSRVNGELAATGGNDFVELLEPPEKRPQLFNARIGYCRDGRQVAKVYRNATYELRLDFRGDLSFTCVSSGIGEFFKSAPKLHIESIGDDALAGLIASMVAHHQPVSTK
jgi:hypothetical protein